MHRNLNSNRRLALSLDMSPLPPKSGSGPYRHFTDAATLLVKTTDGRLARASGASGDTSVCYFHFKTLPVLDTLRGTRLTTPAPGDARLSPPSAPLTKEPTSTS